MDMQFIKVGGLVKVLRSGDCRLTQSRSDPNVYGIILPITNFVYTKEFLTSFVEESGPVVWLEMYGIRHEVLYPTSYQDPLWNDGEFPAVWMRGMIIRVIDPMDEPLPEEFFF